MLLAISKADLLDEILMAQMSKEIDVPMPYLLFLVFPDMAWMPLKTRYGQ